MHIYKSKLFKHIGFNSIGSEIRGDKITLRIADHLGTLQAYMLTIWYKQTPIAFLFISAEQVWDLLTTGKCKDRFC